MLTIREIQKETGGITEFVPLPFMPYNNPVGEKMIKEGRYATPGLEDLKVYAVSDTFSTGMLIISRQAGLNWERNLPSFLSTAVSMTWEAH